MLVYRKGNIGCHSCNCILIYRPLFYPLLSLCLPVLKTLSFWCKKWKLEYSGENAAKLQYPGRYRTMEVKSIFDPIFQLTNIYQLSIIEMWKRIYLSFIALALYPCQSLGEGITPFLSRNLPPLISSISADIFILCVCVCRCGCVCLRECMCVRVCVYVG